MEVLSRTDHQTILPGDDGEGFSLTTSDEAEITNTYYKNSIVYEEPQTIEEVPKISNSSKENQIAGNLGKSSPEAASESESDSSPSSQLLTPSNNNRLAAPPKTSQPPPAKSFRDAGHSKSFVGGQTDTSPRLTRSLTMRADMDDDSPRLKRRSLTSIQVDRLRHAKLTAENALKLKQMNKAKTIAETALRNGRIFTIIGPYKRVREVLRNRGWVEKFYRLQDGVQAPVKATSTSSTTKNSSSTSKPSADDDDSDDDDGGDDDGDDSDDNDGYGNVKPWEEEDGIYGIMSRIVRNSTPTFIWSLRKGQVDFKFLKKEQIVNHHAKAHFFTTKVGLCKILRDLHWYHDLHADQFFPRCYILTVEEEKEAFIEDYRFCACIALIKIVVSGDNLSDTPEDLDILKTVPEDPDTKDTARSGNGKKSKKILPKIRYFNKRVPGASVPQEAIDIALTHCEAVLKSKENEDIDSPNQDKRITPEKWDQLLQWYYKVIQKGAIIDNANSRLAECTRIYEKLRPFFPQIDLDGVRNVWILKPGAKSRGRGIACYDKLEDLLRLVSSSMPKGEAKYILQKYIERPLLVYNTKFDIRQWFLVTDWNPLTIWWYKGCYVRFCSQQFTLEDFNESVHLSNNSIQYKYENGPRSSNLPDENMWDSDDFKNWLRRQGEPTVWDKVISPGMKESVISSMLCTQDLIDVRKNCFELYGADFMITDDYKPWLIEINSSPCMSPSTVITARMTAAVIDDTMKIVIDRRSDRNCDVGGYELLYRQSQVPIPPYSGIDLTLSGTQVRRPYNYPVTTTSTTLITGPASSTTTVNNAAAASGPPAPTISMTTGPQQPNPSSSSAASRGPPRCYEVARAKQERDVEKEAKEERSVAAAERRSSLVTGEAKPPRCYEVAREKQAREKEQQQMREAFEPGLSSVVWSTGEKDRRRRMSSDNGSLLANPISTTTFATFDNGPSNEFCHLPPPQLPSGHYHNPSSTSSASTSAINDLGSLRTPGAKLAAIDGARVALRLPTKVEMVDMGHPCQAGRFPHSVKPLGGVPNRSRGPHTHQHRIKSESVLPLIEELSPHDASLASPPLPPPAAADDVTDENQTGGGHLCHKHRPNPRMNPSEHRLQAYKMARTSGPSPPKLLHPFHTSSTAGFVDFRSILPTVACSAIGKKPEAAGSNFSYTDNTGYGDFILRQMTAAGRPSSSRLLSQFEAAIMKQKTRLPYDILASNQEKRNNHHFRLTSNSRPGNSNVNRVSLQYPITAISVPFRGHNS